jgi:hypothetical protein
MSWGTSEVHEKMDLQDWTSFKEEASILQSGSEVNRML